MLDAVSGYMGGHTPAPTYEQVCTGTTGHAETVRVTFDPAITDFATLARLFFEIHDPTTPNRQGVDVGTQYRSVVFYTDDTQQKITLNLLQQLQKLGWEPVTEVIAAGTFTPAEDYHQDFTARTGRGDCHLRVRRFEENAPR